MRPDVAASKKQQIMRDLDQLSDSRLLDRLRILDRQPDTVSVTAVSDIT